MSHHYAEGSKVVERIEAKLPGLAEYWIRMPQKSWHKAKRGDHVVILDKIDGELTLGDVIDSVRDGKYQIVAYGITKELPDTRTLRKKLASVGVRVRSANLRSARFDTDWKSVLRTVK